MLSISSTSSPGDCTRQNCAQGDRVKLDCYARSVVYESSCTICHPVGKTDKAELEERRREEEENDRWMEFLKKREISNANVRKRVLPDWLDLEFVQKPVKRMKLEEVTSFPASPNQNPEPELERSIMTITNRKIFQP